MEDKQTDHGNQHQHHTNAEERFRRHLTQDERTQKTARRTENKIKTGCKSSIIQSHTDALHQNLRGGSVRTYVNADMTHDTNKTKQDKRFTKQGDALSESRRFAIFFFLFNLCDIEQKNSYDSYNHINREQDAPA